jgi:ribonuclease BN (tRNA processing enzyme)
MRRVVVLGGSAASPNTGAGCSGYLIESSAARILVDPGPGTLHELRRWADFRSLSAVLVSHLHLDHMLDLLALRHALAYNPIPPAYPLQVWMPPAGPAFVARVVAPFDECDAPGVFDTNMEVREYDPGRELLIGDISVTFMPTVHHLPCWAMRFDAALRSVGFTADTGPCATLERFFSAVDVLLAEATLLAHDDTTGVSGSMTADEAATLAHRAGVGRLVLTHYWEEREPERLLSRAEGVYRGPIELARPGLVIDLGGDHRAGPRR